MSFKKKPCEQSELCHFSLTIPAHVAQSIILLKVAQLDKAFTYQDARDYILMLQF